jgi:glucosamine--fructose-6-phosphate aminotransferase (isomerizing)
MCGIFGVIVKKGSDYDTQFISKTLKHVALLSKSRGKDSSGVVFKNAAEKKFQLVKGDIPVNKLLQSPQFDLYCNKSLKSYSSRNYFLAIGHARLVTNGSQLLEENNQPVVKSGVIGIHNGIITNEKELWSKYSELKHEYDIDTEILLSLSRHYIDNGLTVEQSLSNTLSEIKGTVSAALTFNDMNAVALVTNNGSLYYFTNSQDFFVFASESFFITDLLSQTFFKKVFSTGEVKHLKPLKGCVINVDDFSQNVFDFDTKNNNTKLIPSHDYFPIEKINLEGSVKKDFVIEPSVFMDKSKDADLVNLLKYDLAGIKKLIRCTKCLYPETFPFIVFDDKGVCNYCHNYKIKNQPKPLDELVELIKPYKSKNGEPDCIIPFSGGRDSTYVLHFVKKELGLNPIAFTYDWGMVTDLARRNAARVCGKLAVENVIVAADLRLKRRNIQKNIQAWLKKPKLGMIPLFMAGDKYFFYYANKLLAQNNLDLSIWGANPLENTDFKTGFAGIEPSFNKKRIDDLNLTNKINLARFFAGNYLSNPGYINSSLIDTTGAFVSRYMIKRRGFFQLFNYIRWDEKEIDNLIINEYDWEKSIDTDSTWRIGDGTAAFYNYIYTTVAGFSEFDTFRSNQIREGQLSREEALKLVEKENIPRYENIRWYLEIIGMDFKSTIETINRIPKLYHQ